MRREASKIIELLKELGSEGFVHGSLARGDVDQYSDIDIILLRPIPSHILELASSMGGYTTYGRRISQATPGHTPKGHIYLDPYEKVSITFPMIELRPLELEFYRFGGIIDETALKRDTRIPGCTKRLTLIKPTMEGHLETNIAGREVEVADILDVSSEIIRERIRVLSRRDRIGRTGVFLNIEVGEDESFGKVFKRLLESNPAIRRTYHTRKRR